MPRTINPADPLSNQEKRVMDRIVEGKHYKDIAESMNLHISTIITYATRARHKLGAVTMNEASAKYREMVLTQPCPVDYDEVLGKK